MWGIWQAGGIGCARSRSLPAPVPRYTIEASGSSVVGWCNEFESLIEPLARERSLRMLSAEEISTNYAGTHLPDIPAERRGLILYASGTTNRPKGVVTTH